MLVVTDTSKRGILTAQRIGELSKELDISFKEQYLILNRIKPEKEDEMLKKVDEIGLNVIGTIYEDEIVAEYDLEGKPLIDLPDDSNANAAISKIVNYLDLID
jgi:CO dehydrogenase maturation factor